MAKSMSLDEFESNYRRNTSTSLTLSRQAREELLLEWGATFNEIIDAIRANVKAKHQRRRTVSAIGTYDRWEEVMENASRKLKRTLTLKKSKKVEDFAALNSSKARRDNNSSGRRGLQSAK
jgi:hypothetical protein